MLHGVLPESGSGPPIPGVLVLDNGSRGEMHEQQGKGKYQP